MRNIMRRLGLNAPLQATVHAIRNNLTNLGQV
jgi:DNA-binding NarL/FixJ family response regulator